MCVRVHVFLYGCMYVCLYGNLDVRMYACYNSRSFNKQAEAVSVAVLDPYEREDGAEHNDARDNPQRRPQTQPKL